MDFRLDSDQTALVSSVRTILDKEAGPERASRLLGQGSYATSLHAILAEAGYLDVARETGSALEAELVVEEAAAGAGLITAGACALVAPAILDDLDTAHPVALAKRGPDQIVRYAAAARWILGIDGDDAVVMEVADGEIEPEGGSFGVCTGTVPETFWSKRPVYRLPDKAATLASWWQVANAAELCGSSRAALDTTTRYLGQREQFGRPISSFQAVQHRLAECAVMIEGATWLTRVAAARSAPPLEAAEACAYATAAARHVAYETHQLSGAIGLTTEFPLHVWTTQIFAQALELGGSMAIARAAADAAWHAAATHD
jgi:hypothetical protein